MSDTMAAETPMSDHVARFWQLLETEHVRILIDMRREVGVDSPDGLIVYWDGASFGDDVAKALVADRAAAVQERRVPEGDTLGERIVNMVIHADPEMSVFWLYKRANELVAALSSPPAPAPEGEGAYLVWSNEHRAWWRPDCRGYTVHLQAAGRYSREDAIKHSQSRDPGNPPPEIPVREADAIAALVAEKSTP